MKILSKYLFILILLSISANSVFAEVIQRVKWNNSINKIDNNTFELVFKASIESGWHLYGLNIPEGGPVATSFNYEDSEGFELQGKPSSSISPTKKYDNTFEMELELYDGIVTFKQTVKLLKESANIKGFIEFMACDDSRCLPPTEEYFDFNTETGTTNAIVSEKSPTLPSFQTKKLDINLDSKPIIEESIDVSDESSQTNEINAEKSSTEKEKSNNSLWRLFLLSIIAGLGAILTPCVYPIIPLTVSFFSSGSNSKANTITKALAFGLSLIAIYTSVGLISGIFQIDLMKAVTSHWLPNAIFFLMFLAFAASFFGAFEIMLPNKWANKIDSKADKGGIIGAFFMALATAVVSFSCTGPIAGIALGNALKGDITTPVIGMLGFGFGFAFPFTLLAFFPQVQKKLPKSGGWLNSVKVVFAFLMLLFSLIFLGMMGNGAIPRDIILAIAVSILVLLGLYLIGKIKFSHDSNLPYISVPRILLAVASWAIALYLATGIFGAPLSKLSPLLPAKHTLGIDLTKHSFSSQEISSNSTCHSKPKWSETKMHLPHGIKGYFDWEEALSCAKEQNKPVLVDFVGHSCKNCKKMYEEVINDPRVLNKINNDFVMLAMYTDDRTKLPEDEWFTSSLDGRIKKTVGKKNLDFQVTKFETNALPMYVIVNPEGDILTKSKKYFTYSKDVEAFLEFLAEGKNNL